MAGRTTGSPTRSATVVAGVAYPLIIVLGVFKVNFLEAGLVVSGDDAATAGNLAANEWLFRVGIVSEIVLFMLVVSLALALYVILKAVDENLALAALLFRLGEGVVGGIVTVISGLMPLLLLDGEAAFGTAQMQALVGSFLDVRTAGLDIIMIFMSPGGIIFCYLFLKSRYVPSILAIWGIVTYSTMLGYSIVHILFPDLPEMVSIILFTPGGLFEVTLGLWLLFRGVDTKQLNDRVPEPARDRLT